MSEQRGPFEVLSSTDVYKNPWLRVHEDKVIRPGGKEGIFGVVEMKPGSSVLALTDDGAVYLVKEYKYGIGRESLEVMSGAIDGDETPLQAAKRELQEELGLEAEEWVDLGVVNPFTTVVNSPNYIFLALRLKQTTTNPDEGELLEPVKVPFEQAFQMAMSGEISHAASGVLILKAAQYIRER